MVATACFAAVVVLTSTTAALADEQAADRSRSEYADETSSALAARLLRQAGIRGGLVVQLGCGDGRLTAALAAESPSLVVQALDVQPARVQKARSCIRAAGLYGRASVRIYDGRRLPYVDNLVTLLIVKDQADVPDNELLRVLVPGGVALREEDGTWNKMVKPWPEELDQWPQYLHGPDNNAVAHDRRVGPPRHLQWVGRPRWSRSHMAIPTVNALVTAGGRLFSIEDTATPEHPFLPGRFALVARDAFNGIVLWTHRFDRWEPITRYVKDLAVQLQRRIAATEQVVYCTPGLNAPVTAFDSRTGRVLRVYEDTKATQEFAYKDGVLFLVIGQRMNAARYNIVKAIPSKGVNLGGFDPQAPFGGCGFRGAYAPETPDRPVWVSRIVAMDASSGRPLWSTPPIRNYVAATMALHSGRLVYQTLQGLVCLDSRTGDVLWRVDKAISSGDGTQPNTLVLTDKLVLSQEGKTLHAYRLEDGQQLWTASIRDNYEKSADLFFIDGAVWIGGAGWPTKLDAETGRTLVTYRQKMDGPMGHDRCYRNFVTTQFYINSKTGGADFVRLKDGREFPNHWVRGTCGMGVLPANGLLYAPPYSCQCNVGALLRDFNALATEPGLERPDQPLQVPRQARLVRGPAYEWSVQQAVDTPPDPSDWPAYRHDGTRGGVTSSRVKLPLAERWTAKLTTKPSAATAAAGLVFVADVDAHSVLALDAQTGQLAWDFTADGRIDSPPSYAAGRLVFGSADGWVYCLRARDGVLAWKFRDLPDRTVCAFGQPESAWPVHGSVLVHRGTVYFAAGRSSFLDGGIFLYALDLRTGQVVHSRGVYGPFDPQTGFPETYGKDADAGFLADIFVTDGRLLYLRHKAFNFDLSDAQTAGPHVLPSAGFLDPVPQHRTYWTVASRFRGATALSPLQPQGDILVTDGKTFYEVRGFPVHRHSYFDPRRGGYLLVGGRVVGDPLSPRRRKPRGSKQTVSAVSWTTHIPLTGKAMALAGDVLFVAGTPAYFPPDHSPLKYEAAYQGKLGGVLWAASVTDGRKLAEYKLPAAPRWDGLAVADGRLIVCLANGEVMCFEGSTSSR